MILCRVSYTRIYAFGVLYQTGVAFAKLDTLNKEVNINFYNVIIEFYKFYVTARNMKEVVIASAVRTPIGAFGGKFKDVSAVQLGTIAAKEALKRANLEPNMVDEVIFGNVLQAGLGQSVARQVSIHAGIPVEVPSFTVNKVCGSGLKTVALAVQAILAGEADIVLAGGTENMSQAQIGRASGRERV